MLLNGLAEIPAYQWRLASQFGFSGAQAFRFVEWPVIRGLLPGAAGIVFMLCFTSFAIVLSLGGGPRSTTLEVAIYQAIRFDFDLARAVALSLIQIVLCLGLALLFFSTRSIPVVRADQSPGLLRPDLDQRGGKWIDTTIVLCCTVFLLSPFVAVVAHSVGSEGWAIVTTGQFGDALRSSLVISVSAGLLSTLLGLSIAYLVARLRLGRRRWLGTLPEVIGMLTLLMPPITLGSGLFLLLRSFTDVLSLGQFLVIAINALFTLAFTLRILVGPVHSQVARFGRLSESLGVRGIDRWRLILWPSLKKPACYAAAVATTLSVGDMGVIALFGTNELSTLPLLIFRLLGSYRLEQAGVVAICLCALCFLLFVMIERLARIPSGVERAT